MSSILSLLELRDRQPDAVTLRDQHVVVTAGAGSGKTRTLVGRYLALLEDGVPLRSLVAITFTEKAAREMRSRVRKFISEWLAQEAVTQRELWQNAFAELDSARIGTIKLGAIAIEASQSGAIEAAVTPASPHDACASLKLHREGDQVAAAGLIGDQTFGVSAEAECAWRAQASVSWITLHAGSGSRGNGTVAYVVAPNDTPDVRHGAIVIGERAFVVNQAKASADSGGGNDGGSDGGGGGSGDGDGGSGSGGGSG